MGGDWRGRSGVREKRHGFCAQRCGRGVDTWPFSSRQRGSDPHVGTVRHDAFQARSDGAGDRGAARGRESRGRSRRAPRRRTSPRDTPEPLGPAMIGVANRGKSFRALIAYVLRNKDGIDQDPVAWTASRNLPTDDPQLAVSFMNATALRTPSVPEPAYHIAFSFAPEDPVDQTMAERGADHLLARLGLSEPEAVLVAHRDRPHAHDHIVVHRIHPETGRTWRPWHDWQRIRQALSAQERALGLRPVDSHVERVNELAS